MSVYQQAGRIEKGRAVASSSKMAFSSRCLAPVGDIGDFQTPWVLLWVWLYVAKAKLNPAKLREGKIELKLTESIPEGFIVA